MKKVASILSKVSLFLGAIIFMYFIFLLSLPGNLNFGLSLTGLLCLALMLCGYILHYKKDHIWIGIWKLVKIGMIVFACWLVSLVLVVSLLMYNAKPVKIADPDYLIILGASLDGNKPGLTLQERLREGLAYLQEHPETPVIVSGGQGAGETISEAEAMSIFLRENDIPESRIILEENSRSTSENFKYSAEILKRHGKTQPVKIMIVTSDFHLPRSTMLAGRNGFIAGRIPAPTPLSVLPVNLLREYFALGKSFALDR